ncbi:hypothetical protein Taro_053679 [Colocasia esculenta]|uniref:UBN2 domain-containing protein n=1 Tax=Colocasia esculenta TaxID=4460 RepID=A0A843XMW3_COLES|nr:hypothetical protein [Colocasia esculenta]
MEDDKKKISLNCKAKSILCCALSKKEFNYISACMSAMEMWEKLRITYEGTDKVKETRIDILVTQYERLQMQPGETITQMYSRFTDITNGLAGLGKTYEMGDMVRKILRSLLASWTPNVTEIEEANDLKRMSLEKLIGSLMAHEINMERLGESSSRKKHSNALKAEEDTLSEESDGVESAEGSEDEEAFLSRRLQCKKKHGLGYTPPDNEETVKLSLFKSMAASGISDSVGGYGAEFLTAEQQERFTSMKIKACGNKAVDVSDFHKNGMGSIIAAMERMKWSKMATLSEIEEDGSLTSTIKGTQSKITYGLLESLFGVCTIGHCGVHTVDI